MEEGWSELVPRHWHILRDGVEADQEYNNDTIIKVRKIYEIMPSGLGMKKIQEPRVFADVRTEPSGAVFFACWLKRLHSALQLHPLL